MAIADPTRRAILHRLATGETRVTDLAAIAMSLNSVSSTSAFSNARARTPPTLGREHLLSINPALLDDAARWIETQRPLERAFRRADSLLKDEDRRTALRQRKEIR
jgi:DNA-binding transcriptional ArsR family regulator